MDLVRLLLLDLPCTWNSLPEYLRDPELSIDNFPREKHSCLHITEGDTL